MRSKSCLRRKRRGEEEGGGRRCGELLGHCISHVTSSSSEKKMRMNNYLKIRQEECTGSDRAQTRVDRNLAFNSFEADIVAVV